MGPVLARYICPRLQHVTSSEWFLSAHDTRSISTQIIVQFIFLCSIAYTFFFSDPVEQRKGESAGAGGTGFRRPGVWSRGLGEGMAQRRPSLRRGAQGAGARSAGGRRERVHPLAGARRGRAGHRQASRTRAAAGPAGRRGACDGTGLVGCRAGDGSAMAPASLLRAGLGAGPAPASLRMGRSAAGPGLAQRRDRKSVV